jgi:tRNA 2-thiouridine synthesizing protein A
LESGNQDNSLPSALLAIESESALTSVVNMQLDARQLTCPLPLLKARQALRDLNANDLVRVLTTDAGSLKDFVSFAQLTGNLLERFLLLCYS